MENKKLRIQNRILMASLLIALTVIGILICNNQSLASEVIIGNEELIGEDNNFGTTVAIYVEQNEGQKDYIQKNNVPTENVYVVNARTHCVGGGI